MSRTEVTPPLNSHLEAGIILLTQSPPLVGYWSHRSWPSYTLLDRRRPARASWAAYASFPSGEGHICFYTTGFLPPLASRNSVLEPLLCYVAVVRARPVDTYTRVPPRFTPADNIPPIELPTPMRFSYSRFLAERTTWGPAKESEFETAFLPQLRHHAHLDAFFQDSEDSLYIYVPLCIDAIVH